MAETADISTSAQPRWWRRVAIGLGWIKAVLVVLLAIVSTLASGQDAAGRAMAGGFLAGAALYGLLVLAPALYLAHTGRRLGLSLALLVVPDALLVLATQFL